MSYIKNTECSWENKLQNQTQKPVSADVLYCNIVRDNTAFRNERITPAMLNLKVDCLVHILLNHHQNFRSYSSVALKRDFT